MTQDKQNKRPNVPPLRFPEFTEPWETAKLGEVVEFCNERISTSELSIDNYVSTENLLQDFQGVLPANSIPADTNVISYKEGDILISNIRPYLRKVWKADNRGGCSTDVFVLRTKKSNCNSSFINYQIANDRFITYVMSGAKGVKMPRGDKKQMEKYSLSYPSFEEQDKIAHLLALLEQRIALQNGLINKLESLIGGITLSITTSDDCESIRLSEILTERNEVNTAQYEVYSVSVSQGVVNQVEYLGRSFAAKDTSNYNVVHYGDIVYTKSPTGDFPYGIVKRSNQAKPVAVSPLYGVYIPASNDIGCFLHYYFCNAVSTKNYLHKLIQKGAKNTINITNQRFLENTIKLPNAEKLAIVVKLLNQLSVKKQRAEDLLALYRKQKQHLLSQMFI